LLTEVRKKAAAATIKNIENFLDIVAATAK
jgi:hypothetical protein